MGYRFPGDVDVGNVTIVSDGGEVFNVKNMALEINIYQSLFSHYLQCDVAIEDAVNINNSIKGNVENKVPSGFNGGEVLVITYRERTDASMDAKIPWKRHMFGIYEISDRQRLNENTESYIISGISMEAYQTIPQKISRVFGRGGGNTISKMMKGIWGEYLYTNTMKDQYKLAKVTKSFMIDETSGLQKFVIPNLSVDDTIDFLASEADSDDHHPLYMFYEDSNGFCFKNIPNLIRDATKMDTYTYFMSNIAESNTKDGVKNDDQYKIIGYNTIKDTNILDNVKGGLYKAKTIGLDILKKSSHENIFNYEKEKDNFITLQGGRFNASVDGDPVLTLTNIRTGHDNDPFFSKEKPLPKKNTGIFNKKRSYQKQIFNNVMEVSIHGDSTKNVGELVYLIFYIHNNVESDKGQIDKNLSGRYLITKVRQKINDNVFTTILQCSKDTGLI